MNLTTSKYEISLSNYKERKYLECPQCGKMRFKPYCYPDGSILDKSCGRCNREINCGYHLSPKDFFKSKNDKEFLPKIERVKIEPKKMFVLEKSKIEPFMDNYRASTLFYWLQSTGLDFAPTFQLYKVGAGRNGATVYPQFDSAVFRTAKIMMYKNGKRDRSHFPPVDWMHTKLKLIKEDEELRQCFFGRHLLNRNDPRPICLVESEKSALICAAIFPNAVWLASGGRTQINQLNLSELTNKKTIIFPDFDSVEFWREKTKMFPRFKIMDLRNYADDLPGDSDIADVILFGKNRKPMIYFIKTLIFHNKA